MFRETFSMPRRLSSWKLGLREFVFWQHFCILMLCWLLHVSISLVLKVPLYSSQSTSQPSPVSEPVCIRFVWQWFCALLRLLLILDVINVSQTADIFSLWTVNNRFNWIQMCRLMTESRCAVFCQLVSNEAWQSCFFRLWTCCVEQFAVWTSARRLSFYISSTAEVTLLSIGF